MTATTTDETEKLRAELEESQQHAQSLLALLIDLRFALGDNGLRMQDELVEFARQMRDEHLAALAACEAKDAALAAVQQGVIFKDFAQPLVDLVADAIAIKPGHSAPATEIDVAKAIHYPECWDTAAYPTLESAISEIAAFRCTNDDCAAAPVAVLNDTDIADLKRVAHDFDGATETEISQDTLMRLANLGLLECTYFEVTPKGRCMLAVAPTPDQIRDATNMIGDEVAK